MDSFNLTVAVNRLLGIIRFYGYVDISIEYYAIQSCIEIIKMSESYGGKPIPSLFNSNEALPNKSLINFSLSFKNQESLNQFFAAISPNT